MDDKSLCLIQNLYSQNLISNLIIYYSNNMILNNSKILPSCYNGISLFKDTNNIYLINYYINAIQIIPINNDILTLKSSILRCYSTPLNLYSKDSYIEGILCLLKDAYFNNTQISLQVHGIMDTIPTLDYLYILSFDCDVLWLNNSNKIYLVSIKNICEITLI